MPIVAIAFVVTALGSLQPQPTAQAFRTYMFCGMAQVGDLAASTDNLEMVGDRALSYCRPVRDAFEMAVRADPEEIGDDPAAVEDIVTARLEGADELVRELVVTFVADEREEAAEQR